MRTEVLPDPAALAQAAAQHAAGLLRHAITARGQVRIVAASGASQLAFLKALVAAEGIDWQKVELFHLDEYLELPAGHPASFCRYIRERIIEPTGISRFHLLETERGIPSMMSAVTRAISSAPIDVAFIGIGENGHLAFNDPPANFDTEEPYIVVNLDEACRRQQVSEGWFTSLDEVPKRAVSMSIRQMLQARDIVSVVPDRRKAEAVKAALTADVSPQVPASALRRHPRAALFLDAGSAALLDPADIAP